MYYSLSRLNLGFFFQGYFLFILQDPEPLKKSDRLITSPPGIEETLATPETKVEEAEHEPNGDVTIPEEGKIHH